MGESAVMLMLLTSTSKLKLTAARKRIGVPA
jgi:hypothetical protein